MNKRPISRKLLASFIEYEANGVVGSIEWNRFAINHYNDATMERARSEAVGILVAQPDPRLLTAEQRNALYKLAKELRSAA